MKDGDIEAVRSAGKRIEFDPIDPAEPYSVARLFETAASAATTAGTIVQASFDADLGYPTRVTIRDDRPDAVHLQTVRVVRFRAARDG